MIQINSYYSKSYKSVFVVVLQHLNIPTEFKQLVLLAGNLYAVSCILTLTHGNININITQIFTIFHSGILSFDQIVCWIVLGLSVILRKRGYTSNMLVLNRFVLLVVWVGQSNMHFIIALIFFRIFITSLINGLKSRPNINIIDCLLRTIWLLLCKFEFTIE